MNVEELLSFKPASMTPSREASSDHHHAKRKRKSAAGRDDSGILKKPQLSSAVKHVTNNQTTIDSVSKTDEPMDSGIEISEEERQRILQMVEDEPEVRHKLSLYYKHLHCCHISYSPSLMTTQLFNLRYWNVIHLPIRGSGEGELTTLA